MPEVYRYSRLLRNTPSSSRSFWRRVKEQLSCHWGAHVDLQAKLVNKLFQARTLPGTNGTTHSKVVNLQDPVNTVFSISRVPVLSKSICEMRIQGEVVAETGYLQYVHDLVYLVQHCAAGVSFLPTESNLVSNPNQVVPDISEVVRDFGHG